MITPKSVRKLNEATEHHKVRGNIPFTMEINNTPTVFWDCPDGQGFFGQKGKINISKCYKCFGDLCNTDPERNYTHALSINVNIQNVNRNYKNDSIFVVQKSNVNKSTILKINIFLLSILLLKLN